MARQLKFLPSSIPLPSHAESLQNHCVSPSGQKKRKLQALRAENQWDSDNMRQQQHKLIIVIKFFLCYSRTGQLRDTPSVGNGSRLCKASDSSKGPNADSSKAIQGLGGRATWRLGPKVYREQGSLRVWCELRLARRARQ